MKAKENIDKAIELLSKASQEIQREQSELAAATIGLGLKVMEIKPCYKLGQIYSSIESYQTNGHPKLNVHELCKKAAADLDKLYKESVAIHESNLPAIENNKLIREAITKLMESVGIPATYATYEYPTNRSRTKRQESHNAGWYGDLMRVVKVDDQWSMVEGSYNRQLKNIEDYRIVKAREEDQIKQAAEQKEKKRLAEKTLAAMVVKYELPYESDWDSVLEAILDKNKYLHLAHWLRRQRNDWSDGFWKAENSIHSFHPENEQDNDILKNLIETLDGVEDGRAFRDCEWNYDKIFGLVEDEDLMKDYNIAVQHDKDYA